MCYSAEVWTLYKQYVDEFGAMRFSPSSTTSGIRIYELVREAA